MELTTKPRHSERQLVDSERRLSFSYRAEQVSWYKGFVSIRLEEDLRKWFEENLETYSERKLIEVRLSTSVHDDVKLFGKCE